MSTVEINDVAARDGFQVEASFIPTDDKIRVIDALSCVGLARIEATAFVSPKSIPNLCDAVEVMEAIQRPVGMRFTVLVPNMRGAERALACRVDEINLVMSASDSHGLANLRMTSEQSLAQFRSIVEVARGSGVFINASVSTTFGCPFEGPVDEQRVIQLVERLLALGIDGITLCDTTGMANPAQVERFCNAALERFPTTPFTLHMHNTRGMGLANVLSAWQAGVTCFDGSLGGLGGCPYAPGATGNVCTEDMVHMFEQMGVNTGVDLEALLTVSAALPELVGHEVPGQVVKAGTAGRRYATPCR